MTPQPQWLETDFYEVLGIHETASDQEIRSAYRKLARTAHPDAHPDDPGAEERFKAITAAYDVLGDADKRREYDEFRRLGPNAFAGATGARSGDGRVRVNVGNLDDLGDLRGFGGLFDDFFGDPGFGTGPTTRGQHRPGRRSGRPGRDLATEVRLPFTQAVFGTTTSIGLTSEAGCDTCDGSGASPGSGRVTCQVCRGSGAQVTGRGGFAMRQACDRCGGMGDVLEQPCATCRGSGRVRRHRNIKVRIPAGVDDGQTIRLPGRGEPGYDGGPPGDLYVTVDVEPHPTFGRVGNNLTLTVPITYPEAVLGAKVTVPTLDGDNVTVRVPPGTPGGRVLRIGGRGVPEPGKHGDLLLTLDIDVPTNPSAVERDLIEQLATATTTKPRAKWETAR